MKQDRRKQIIALLLAASIVSLSATGCAQQRPADSASAQQEQQQPEQQPESAAQTPDSHRSGCPAGGGTAVRAGGTA